MRDVLMEIVQDRVDEIADQRERETTAMNLKSLMANLKFTVEQAMDALSIPQAQRSTYARLV